MRKNSGWNVSPSKIFYTICTDEILKIANANLTKKNNPLSPDNVFFTYDRMLAKTLMATTECIESTQPIVWKTMPSRMRYYFGQYVCVKIHQDDIGSISQYNVTRTKAMERAIVSLHGDNFFKSFPSVNIIYQKNSRSPLLELPINLRTFLFHMVLYKTYNSINKKKCTTKVAKAVLNEGLGARLGLMNWLDDDRQLYWMVRNAFESLKTEQHMEALLHYAKEYSFEVNEKEEREILNPSTSWKTLVCFCTRKINQRIVIHISKLRQNFQRQVLLDSINLLSPGKISALIKYPFNSHT